MNTLPPVALTLDIDWAPDCVIDAVAQELVDAGVQATFFVTHASPAVDRLRAHPALFELGIHPNFLPGSTQGATPAEVLAYCMALVPDARVVRTHSLVQSTPLFSEIIRRTSVTIDVSLFLPGHRGLHPVTYVFGERPLCRVPYWWEDDDEMFRAPADWDLVARLKQPGTGVRVLDFHPIHVALNSPSFAPYEAFKRQVSPLSAATADDVARARHHGTGGAGAAFRDVITWLAANGGGHTVSGLVAKTGVS